MNIVVYSINLNDETFLDTKGLVVRGISHGDPADIVFTLPDEEGKRFQNLYDSQKEEGNLNIHLRMGSAPADLTKTPVPVAQVKEYELRVLDIDTDEGLYIFSCSGKLKR